MSIAEASKQRYSTKWQQAAYLEAEWSDYLLAEQRNSSSNCDPLTANVIPTFYREIAAFVGKCVSQLQKPVAKYVDIGGSTGRTLREVSFTLPRLSELVLAEPASELTQWARILLLNPGQLDWFPVVHDWQVCRFASPFSLPDPISEAGRAVYVYDCAADDVPRPNGYFDLVTCLNVVDRVPCPNALIASLHRLLAPGGLLVLASPLQFDERFTPDRDRWITDLNSLFADMSWTSLAESSLTYDIRRYRREWLRYSSQVVAKIKKPI